MSKASTRIVLSFLAAFLVAFTGWVFLRHWHAADATALTSTIAGKIAALNLPQRTVELPTEKARRVRDAIKSGDYAAADKVYADVLASSRIESWRFYPFTDFIGSISDLEDPAYERGLDAWIAQDGSDAAALLVRARYYFDVAWARRGDDYSNKTPAAKLAAFQTYIDKALADCEAVIGRDPANPYAFYLRLRILHGLGASQQMAGAFQQAIGRYPGYYPLYTIMLQTLQPKWGGDVPSMYALVDRYAGGAPENSPLKLLYVALYGDLLETAATSSCDVAEQDKDKRAECVSSAMRSLVTPELESAIPLALQLYDHSDKYQFGIALADALGDMQKWDAAETHADTILEIAADTMRSSTQLAPDRPVTNNYVIDKLVAESWYRKGFYDNALQKTREALVDIDSTTFPGEAEKDRAIAGILEDAAAADNMLGQLAEMIAHEESALSLGDLPNEEQYICYGYYRLKVYDSAIRFCTQAIDHAASTMEAHYWRGASYRAKGEADAALEDLTLVAGSEHRLRASAAIDLSMFYFGRKDNAGALEVLNRYDYLYDSDKVDRQSVAVAYNNRCYAYMELGDLQKALDDCNQSLQYGSIPDAYSKKVELMKRLKARETSS